MKNQENSPMVLWRAKGGKGGGKKHAQAPAGPGGKGSSRWLATQQRRAAAAQHESHEFRQLQQGLAPAPTAGKELAAMDANARMSIYMFWTMIMR